MRNARDAALFVLDRKELPGWKANALPRKFGHGKLGPPTDPRDRALAEQIEVGVVKNLLQLQYLIEQIADRPLNKVHPLLQKILSIAIFQLRFLDRVPPSAAVDEGVEQTKRFGLGHARGFANAVLRKAAASRSEPLPVVDDVIERARVHYSHPPELVRRLVSLVGEEQAMAICAHDNAEPLLVARLCVGRSLADVEAAGVQAVAHEQPGMVVLPDAGKEALAQLARAGIAQVQDATSAKVVQAADIRAGMFVLDRCCGMGTKTLQAYELAGHEATIVAIDPSRARCDALREMLIARQITNVQVIESASFPHGNADVCQQFDRVLVDVPCSNSGVLCRRPEARYAQSDRVLEQLRKLQMELLKDAARCIAPGGRLIYSTCSIWPEENQELIVHFLAEHPRLRKLAEETTLPLSSASPTNYHDGGYYAILGAA